MWKFFISKKEEQGRTCLILLDLEGWKVRKTWRMEKQLQHITIVLYRMTPIHARKIGSTSEMEVNSKEIISGDFIGRWMVS